MFTGNRSEMPEPEIRLRDVCLLDVINLVRIRGLNRGLHLGHGDGGLYPIAEVLFDQCQHVVALYIASDAHQDAIRMIELAVEGLEIVARDRVHRSVLGVTRVRTGGAVH